MQLPTLLFLKFAPSECEASSIILNLYFFDNLNKNQGDISLSTFSPASNINYEFNNSNELFINYSSGFETPTLNELSSTVGNSGFNGDLKTSKFNNHEIGVSNLKSNNKIKYRIK